MERVLEALHWGAVPTWLVQYWRYMHLIMRRDLLYQVYQVKHLHRTKVVHAPQRSLPLFPYKLYEIYLVQVIQGSKRSTKRDAKGVPRPYRVYRLPLRVVSRRQ
jgi:hypothetical protein